MGAKNKKPIHRQIYTLYNANTLNKLKTDLDRTRALRYTSSIVIVDARRNFKLTEHEIGFCPWFLTENTLKSLVFAISNYPFLRVSADQLRTKRKTKTIVHIIIAFGHSIVRRKYEKKNAQSHSVEGEWANEISKSENARKIKALKNGRTNGIKIYWNNRKVTHENENFNQTKIRSWK